MSGVGLCARWYGAVIATSLAVAALTALPAAASAGDPATQELCGAPAPGQMRCLGVRRIDVTQPAALASQPGIASPSATPAGYGPPDLVSAYSLDTSLGSGQTVAIVDAYDDPTAEADLAVYRAQYGLPACTIANGCFRKVNQAGASSPAAGRQLPAGPARSRWTSTWSRRSARSATSCWSRPTAPTSATSAPRSTPPSGSARSSSPTATAAASTAASAATTSHFNHPGVAITASTGDNGYGVSLPGQLAVRHRGRRHQAGPLGRPPRLDRDRLGRRRQRLLAAMRQARRSRTWSPPAAPTGRWPTSRRSPTRTPGSRSTTPAAGASTAAPARPRRSSPRSTRWPALPAPRDYPNSYPYQQAEQPATTSPPGSNGSCSVHALCSAGAGWDGPTGLGTPNTAAAFSATGVCRAARPSSARPRGRRPRDRRAGHHRLGATPMLPPGDALASISWKAAAPTARSARPAAARPRSAARPARPAAPP